MTTSAQWSNYFTNIDKIYENSINQNAPKIDSDEEPEREEQIF